MNLGSLFLEKAAVHYPDKVSVVFGDTRITNRILYQRVCKLANTLLDLGLKKGARVGVIMSNSHLAVECFFGITCAGLVLVPMNARNSAKEHIYVLNDSEAEAVILGPEFIDALAPVLEQAPGVAHIICAGGNGPENMLAYEDMVERASSHDPKPDLSEQDMFSIRYTAGTSGKPKGVVHNVGSQLIKVYNHLMDGIGIQKDDSIALTGPVTHASGSNILPHIVRGAQVIILSGFDPETLLKTIQKERVTTLYMVPTMLAKLLHHPDFGQYDISSIKTIRYGASPIATEMLKLAIEKFGNVFVQGYGLTEAGMPMTILSKSDHILDGGKKALERLKSVGREVTAASVRIMDDNGKIAPVGQIGEIVVRSGQMMTEYWKNPEASAETLKDGWLYTRDLGYRDEDGYIFLVDRKNDMIISGGFNVYPREVEEVLYMHPAVMEAAVFGIPDPIWGEALKAVIALKQGHAVTEDEIIAHCKANLGSYKKPKSVDIIPELPKSAYGKILRRELKEPYWQKGNRKIN